MFERLLLVFFVIVAIVAANLWHHFARWFVTTQGTIPSLLLIAGLILLSQLPYWDD